MTEIVGGARERAMAVGLCAMGDGELLELVLGTGSSGEPVGVLAASLLDEHGGLRGLARAGMGALAGRRGLGVAKGARVAAAIELGRRAVADEAGLVARHVADGAAVYAWAKARIVALDHEELWLLSLDGRNRLRAARRVASGGLHGLHVSTRDPLRIALREAASAFVLVHNHPSGDPTPSREDLEYTQAVVAGAEAVGTPLVDHVVVARDGYVSMLERGVLPSRGARP
jgi:DNA repair protein RadC